MNGKRLATHIVEARRRLLRACDELPEEMLSVRPGEHDWSVLEVVAHLAPVDDSYGGQALAVIAGTLHSLSYFDEQWWGHESHAFTSQGWATIRKSASESANHWAGVARLLSDSTLETPCNHHRGIEYSAGQILARLPAHDENHLTQIQTIAKSLQSLDAPASVF